MVVLMPYREEKRGGDPMSTCEMSTTGRSVANATAPATPHPSDHPHATDALHRVRDLALSDPAFEAAFRASATPQEASALAHGYGIDVSAEALWRNRGMLAHGGLPTWRG
jgi:hypothetical protein